MNTQKHTKAKTKHIPKQKTKIHTKSHRLKNKHTKLHTHTNIQADRNNKKQPPTAKHNRILTPKTNRKMLIRTH